MPKQASVHSQACQGRCLCPPICNKYTMTDTGATIKGALEMQAEAFWDRLPQQWPPRSASQPAADDLHLGLRLQQGQVGPAHFASACRGMAHQARRCTGRS